MTIPTRTGSHESAKRSASRSCSRSRASRSSKPPRITRERSGYQIAESTVRQYVRQRKRTLGLRVVPEAFVPEQYAWGDEAQVDYVSEGKRVSDRFASNEPGVIEFVR